MREGLGGTQRRWLPGGGAEAGLGGEPRSSAERAVGGGRFLALSRPSQHWLPRLSPPPTQWGGGRAGEGVIPGGGYPPVSRQRAATSPHARG